MSHPIIGAAVPTSVQDIFKVDLHVHLQALAAGETMRALAAKRGLDMQTLAPGYARQSWQDLWDFHSEYERFYGKLHKEPEDYYRVCYEYLTQAAQQNAIYVEIAGSLRPMQTGKISNEELMAAIGSAFAAAESNYGIKAGFIANTVRDFGPDHALWVAREAVRLREEFGFIRGFGMSGNENHPVPLAEYIAAFHYAHAAGLGCTAHAGETSSQTVVEAAETLGAYLDRFGHGIYALDDSAMLEQYFRRHPSHRGELINPAKKPHCVLEICYSSYEKLNSWAKFKSGRRKTNPAQHLIRELWDEGYYRLVPGTDDPGPFKTDIGNEYRLLHEKCGLELWQLSALTCAGIKYSFLPDADKKPIYAKARAQRTLLQAAGRDVVLQATQRNARNDNDSSHALKKLVPGMEIPGA